MTPAGTVRLAAAAPLLLAGYAGCVLFSEGTADADAGNGFDFGGPDETATVVGSALRGCLVGADPFLPCVNGRAMAALERTESMDSVRLDSGLEMAKSPDADDTFLPRGAYSFGEYSASRLSRCGESGGVGTESWPGEYRSSWPRSSSAGFRISNPGFS